MEAVQTYLEYLRPSFWQGDYNFLWIYIVLIIVLAKLYEHLKSKAANYSTFHPDRVKNNRVKMQEIWASKQEELSKAPKPAPPPQQTEEETKEKDKETETEKKAKKKSDYFTQDNSKSYRPNVKERYPGVYKRSGG